MRSQIYNTSLTLRWKVASLFYEGLIDLFTYLMKIHLASHFTLKSTNWLDEVWRTKDYREQLQSVPHTCTVFKINKQN
jgi:hypothetical protein